MGSKDLVVFFGYSRGVGLCYNFVDFFSELYQTEKLKYSVKLLSTNNEQRTGDLERMRKLAGEDLLIFDEEESIASELPNIIREYSNVVLHVQGLSQLILAKKIKKKCSSNIKIVFTVHAFRNSYWYGGAFSVFLGLLLNKYADHTVFLTVSSRQEFLGRFLVNSSSVIPTGINVEEAKSISTRKTRENFNVVYLANFTKNKGHFWLLKAIAQVVRVNPNVKFHFLGEGKYHSVINKKVSELGLTDNVVMPGRIPRNRLPAYFENMDCAVVASNSETFGHTFLEPMLFGVPVVGTRVGVGPMIIKDYVTGFQVGKNEHKQLADKVLYLSKEIDLSKEMGREAKRRVSSSFTWKSTAIAHSRLYLEVISK